MDYILTTQNLTKKFKDQFAVNDINISIRQGEIYGLVGRNGAGKTTLMKMICGLSNPTTGTVCLFPNENKIDKVKNDYSKLGSLIETPGFFENISGYDNLMIKACCTDVVDKDEHRNKVLSLVGLINVKKKKVKKYSLGMKQRLGVAMALVGEPEFLILDEPINGLDPQGIAEMRALISRLNKEFNITVLISSHILEELLKLATFFCIIENGKIVYEKSSEELEMECRQKNISLEQLYFQITGGGGNA